MMVQPQEEMGEDLERATTTATSLDVDQDMGNINKTQSKATLNEPSSIETSLGSGLRRQDTMGDTITQTSLKRRVKKLKKKKMSRTYKLKRLYKVRLSAIVESSDDKGLGEEDASKQERIIDDLDVDKDITLVNDQEKFNSDKDLQAKALEDLKTSKPNIRGIVIKDHEEPSKSRTTTTTIPKKSHDKGKNKMIEKPVKLKKKDQILFDEEVARKLQEEINKQERLKRRKFFAAKRTEEKRNRPPTKAPQRSLMCTYLKNMDGWKPKALKNKSFVEIQELFAKAMKRINNFIDFRTELVEESSKKAQAKITQEENFDREDVETLWRLVKAKHGSTRPEEGYERVLWGDLKVMFDPHIEDKVWKLQQSYKVDKISDSTLSKLDKPGNYKEAMASPEAAKWKEAMKRSIMYVMIFTRPDVSFALSMVGRDQQNPGKGHWTDQTAKDDSRSQSGWIFLLNGGAVTWKSSKQDTVADSTCESEYIAAHKASNEAIWVKNFI
nr:hypothetical protein [Tanacetum cinerariifolium]